MKRDSRQHQGPFQNKGHREWHRGSSDTGVETCRGNDARIRALTISIVSRGVMLGGNTYMVSPGFNGIIHRLKSSGDETFSHVRFSLSGGTQAGSLGCDSTKIMTPPGVNSFAMVWNPAGEHRRGVVCPAPDS